MPDYLRRCQEVADKIEEDSVAFDIHEMFEKPFQRMQEELLACPDDLSATEEKVMRRLKEDEKRRKAERWKKKMPKACK